MTEEEILAGRSPSGGYTRAQLEAWGVSWPPKKGWKLRLINGEPDFPARQNQGKQEKTIMNDMYPDAALEVLDQAGMVAKTPQPIMNENYDEIDQLVMGAPPAVKFEQIGDMVAGRIVRVYQVQVTDFDTREPQWWDDGQPKMQVVIVLDVAGGEGLRSLYVGSKGMREAVRDACRAVNAGLRPDGHFAVKYTADGEPFKKGARPPKIYEAGYDPPGVKKLDQVMPGPPSLNTAQVSQSDDPPF